MSRAQLVWAVLFAGVTVGVSSVMSVITLPAPLRYGIPIACVLMGAAYFRTMFRDFRKSADELQRRLHLEAAVGACVALYVAMFVYPLFRKAGMVGELDPFLVLLLMAAFYAVGYIMAQRRYR